MFFWRAQGLAVKPCVEAATGATAKEVAQQKKRGVTQRVTAAGAMTSRKTNREAKEERRLATAAKKEAKRKEQTREDEEARKWELKQAAKGKRRQRSPEQPGAGARGAGDPGKPSGQGTPSGAPI